MKILILDDDKNAQAQYQGILSDKFEVSIFQAAEDLLVQLEKKTELPEIILLNLQIECKCLVALFRRIVEITQSAVPIIILTSDCEAEHLGTFMLMGVTDFILRPASPSELIARIHNNIALHAKLRDINLLKVGPFCLDLANRVLEVNGVESPLTPTEHKLCLMLFKSPNTLMEKEVITTALWPESQPKEQSLDVHISNFRKKLGKHNKLLKTVRKKGYLLAI